MMLLLAKFCNAEEIVLNICAGILATAKARLQKPEQQMFVGCEKDPTCFHNVLLLLVEVYLRQVLSTDSHIAKSEEAVEANKMSAKEMATLASKRTVDSWTFQPRLVPVQRLPLHTTCLLWKVYKGAKLFETGR